MHCREGPLRHGRLGQDNGSSSLDRRDLHSCPGSPELPLLLPQRTQVQPLQAVHVTVLQLGRCMLGLERHTMVLSWKGKLSMKATAPAVVGVPLTS